MSMIRWNPSREFAFMRRLMDSVFEDTMRPLRSSLESYEGLAGSLALDVDEEDNQFTVTTSLPGVNPDDIRINLHDDLLTIEAEIPAKTTERTEDGNGGKRALLQERSWGKFSRSIRLPNAVKSDNVEADFDNGVLTLKLPKADHVLPRNIPVKSLKANNQ